MADPILVLNAGSSSVKFSIFDVTSTSDLALQLKGQIEGIGVRPRLTAEDAGGAALVNRTYERAELDGHDAALNAVAQWLRSMFGSRSLLAVGHRVVHGGIQYGEPVVIDDQVLARLEELVPLAPLHQPANLAAIKAVRHHLPELPQVACFDTAFHRGHPELADRYALPEALYRGGIRRYGFHGLSYEYIAGELPRVAPALAGGRVVIAHLGSGASMCAVKAGRSVDSTMGFTALDGLPMGTRCGALDPGVVIHLLREKRMAVNEVEGLLYHDSGLRGLSGISNDVRELLASDDPAARRALDYFTYHAARQLGCLAAVLEGVDGVVFTAGIGERSAEIRARICARAAWLGLRLDATANREGRSRISAAGSAVSAWVIPTNEELMIARHTLAAVRASAKSS
jgi:acetate kinase